MRTVLVLLALAGCGKEEDFSDCALGELTGSWRISYDETDGTCGALSDETIVAGMPGDSACVTEAETLSADKCEMDLAFTCPTQDNRGEYSWALHMEHVDDDLVLGSGTGQLFHPSGNCRSTYDITMTKL